MLHDHYNRFDRERIAHEHERGDEDHYHKMGSDGVTTTIGEAVFASDQDRIPRSAFPDLDRFQAEQREWSARNFGTHNSTHPLLGVFEEAGELSHAHLKGIQGIRHTPEEIVAMKRDAVGDILVYLADYCNEEGFSLGEALDETWSQVRQRDWVADPMNAAAKVQS